MATTPKKGDRVKVTVEGKVTEADGLGRWFTVETPEVYRSFCFRPGEHAVEVIEEPYEEGAIYEVPTGARWLYSPSGDSRKPWVFISFPDQFDGYGFKFGGRTGMLTRPTKLVPSE